MIDFIPEVINTIVFIPKVLSSRGGVFLFFLRLYSRTSDLQLRLQELVDPYNSI